MRFVELFAGAGGLSLGLERAGMTCVGHAEIEPHARAVLRHHWPDVPLWGDVTALRGADFPACDLLSGGSPCQDLSVAGKRAGIVDGARSSLFFTQARLWQESGAPYLLWENVAGALSSNHGRDFALVLSTLVGTTLPVPADGWAGGGVAAGPEAVAAWRVCDLRYFGARGFGPPQRRVRVFVLAARAGGVDPAEVLALSESLCGHPDPRTAAGEGAAAEVGASVAGSLGSHRTGGYRDDLDNNGCYPVQAVPFGWDHRNVTSATNRTGVTPGMVGTIHASGMECVQPIITFVAEMSQHGTDENVMHTLQTVVTPAPLQPWPDVAPTLMARDAKGSGSFRDGEIQALVIPDERPRRLMPLECERLMGWPDDHTAHGVDERGRAYALKDTPRYRLCGNGVGAPVAEWIGRRLMEAVAAQQGEAAA